MRKINTKKININNLEDDNYPQYISWNIAVDKKDPRLDWDYRYDRRSIACKNARNYVNRFYYKHIGEPYEPLVRKLRHNLIEKFGKVIAKEVNDIVVLHPDDDIDSWTSSRYDWFNIDENGNIQGQAYTDHHHHYRPLECLIDGEVGELTDRKSPEYKRMRAERNDAIRKANREYRNAERKKNETLLYDVEMKNLAYERKINEIIIIKHGFDPKTSFRNW